MSAFGCKADIAWRCLRIVATQNDRWTQFLRSQIPVLIGALNWCGFVRNAAVSKQEPSKIDFELIDDARMQRLAKALAIAAMLAFGAQAASAQTLKAVQDRGQLICGANGVLAGFGMPDPQGNWTGFDADYCRAMAAAIFNDPTKVKFVPLTAQNRFTALQSGEVDVLARNTTWTMSRDTTLGLDFAAVNFYDGQGF